MHTLYVFDFDHTLIDEDCILYVKKKLVPGGKLPGDIESKFSEDCWIEYSNAIFNHLHQHAVTDSQIQSCIKEIPMTEGMEDLVRTIASNPDNEMIIISDANCLFIEWLLRHHGLLENFSHVYTNPAQVSAQGCLEMQYFHKQDWCKRSTVNLCKGHILQEYIKTQQSLGVEYSCIAYIGDGTNDYCPSLTLASTDRVFPRSGFALEKAIAEIKGSVLARACSWVTGRDIIDAL